MDPIVRRMQALGLESTRKNYLHLAYFGQPPDELDAEAEAALPKEFQLHHKEGENADSE